MLEHVSFDVKVKKLETSSFSFINLQKEILSSLMCLNFHFSYFQRLELDYHIRANKTRSLLERQRTVSRHTMVIFGEKISRNCNIFMC